MKVRQEKSSRVKSSIHSGSGIYLSLTYWPVLRSHSFRSILVSLFPVTCEPFRTRSLGTRAIELVQLRNLLRANHHSSAHADKPGSGVAVNVATNCVQLIASKYECGLDAGLEQNRRRCTRTSREKFKHHKQVIQHYEPARCRRNGLTSYRMKFLFRAKLERK
jgi:hypothetical protein